VFLEFQFVTIFIYKKLYKEINKFFCGLITCLQKFAKIFQFSNVKVYKVFSTKLFFSNVPKFFTKLSGLNNSIFYFVITPLKIIISQGNTHYFPCKRFLYKESNVIAYHSVSLRYNNLYRSYDKFLLQGK